MTTRIYSRIVFLIVIGVGISIWLNRPPYIAPNFPMHGLEIRSTYQPSRNYDLTDICSPLREPGGYLLVSGSIDMRSIFGERQVFFQTNTTSNRLFLEFDPGKNSILRFGITDETVEPQYISLGLLKKAGTLNFAFLIRQDGAIQVLGNGIVDLPNLLTLGSSGSYQTNNTTIDCSNFRLNAGSGLNGTDGDVEVQVSSGTAYEEGLKLFDEYKLEYRNSLPETKYKWPLYIGILLWVVDSPSIILKLLKKFRPRVR